MDKKLILGGIGLAIISFEAGKVYMGLRMIYDMRNYNRCRRHGRFVGYKKEEVE